MLINLSNHPSANWGAEQTEAAKKFGPVVDIAFPAIDPGAGAPEITALAKTYHSEVEILLNESGDPVNAVHIMGELTFCFALVARLQKAGITCVASTTRRDTVENGDGSKTSIFRFVQFRDYPDLSTLNIT